MQTSHPFPESDIRKLRRLDRRLFVDPVRGGKFVLAYHDESGIRCVAHKEFEHLGEDVFSHLVLQMPWRQNRTLVQDIDRMEAENDRIREKRKLEGIHDVAVGLAEDTAFLSGRSDKVLEDYLQDAIDERRASG